jgi:hypothetical protein
MGMVAALRHIPTTLVAEEALLILLGYQVCLYLLVSVQQWTPPLALAEPEDKKALQLG